MGGLGFSMSRSRGPARFRSSVRRPVFSRRVSKPAVKISKPTINQRKPQVSLVQQKQKVTPKVMARSRIANLRSRPSIFASKPFRISSSSSRFYRTTRRPSILMKYNRPTIDYSSRYRSAVAKNRALTVALSKQKAEAKLAKQKHEKQGKEWQDEKDRYNRSPGYVYDRFADHVNKRYVSATKVISPGINGIGGVEETLSWAGAGLLGLLFVGLIIGRVE